MQTVELDGYFAKITESTDLKYLYFGTWGSYGRESIIVNRQSDWIGKTITASFSFDNTVITQIVHEDGTLDIPKEATAKALEKRNPGRIVFSAVDGGEKVVSTDILFVVLDHAPISGKESDLTPSLYDQLVGLIDTRVPPSGTLGQVLKKGQTEANIWGDAPGSSGGAYNIGHALELDLETNTLSVKVANDVEEDNTLPVTSAAVQVVVGNIDVLLKMI